MSRACCLNSQPLDQGPPRATLTGRGGVLGFLGAPASGAERLWPPHDWDWLQLEPPFHAALCQSRLFQLCPER